jgi:hypothetical protein
MLAKTQTTPRARLLAVRLIKELQLDDKKKYRWHLINNSGLVHYDDQGSTYLIKLIQQHCTFEGDEAYGIIKDCAGVLVPAGFASSKRELEWRAVQVMEYEAHWLIHEMVMCVLRDRGYQFS